ncbi:hypothetical protein [Klebsiella pneumoniae]|uniref:hypothetical protein n=1 Tax=Klebsiella pneumoniae TaxID=573 RepID=UPI00204084F6|nr:hypothetical protein [Klebsiella pneumoniae]USB65914.1 hypothetical protein KU669_03360 [Klebsiella pneumoniae]
MTKVYITKYALTDGPFAIEGEINDGVVTCGPKGYQQQFAHGMDWWLTEDEALADCERRRHAKLKSIEKKRKKLEKMKFTIAEPKSN